MITYALSTFNTLNYLKLAIHSARENGYYKDAPFVVHAENCTDGTNEWFQIDNIEQPCHLPNTVEIYNRWGVLVYETQNYDNNTRRFEGMSEGRTTVNKSSELPTGTYFYIIQWTDGTQKVTKDGYLYLTR